MIKHITQVTINNFRGISNLKYTPRQINILIGKNNAGKTTLLDAIYYSIPHQQHFGSSAYYDVKTGCSTAEIITDTNKCRIYINKDEVPQDLLKKCTGQLRKALQSAGEALDIPENKNIEIEVQMEKILNYQIAEINGDNRIILDMNKILHENSREMITLMTNLPNPIQNTNVQTKKSEDTYVNTAATLSKYGIDTGNISDKEIVHKKNRALQYILFLYNELNKDDNNNENNKENTQQPNQKVVFCDNSTTMNNLQFSDPLHLIQLEQIVKEYNLIPNVERLTNEGVVYNTDTGFILIPYSSHGAGFVSLLNLIDKMYSAKSGIILIEEPENHMHPGYIGVFVEQIITLAEKLDVQVFMTTHSADLIEEFANYPESGSHEEEIIQIASIVKRFNEHELYTYSPSEALDTMNNLLIDLRGA